MWSFFRSLIEVKRWPSDWLHLTNGFNPKQASVLLCLTQILLCHLAQLLFPCSALRALTSMEAKGRQSKQTLTHPRIRSDSILLRPLAMTGIILPVRYIWRWSSSRLSLPARLPEMPKKKHVEAHCSQSIINPARTRRDPPRLLNLVPAIKNTTKVSV